MKIDRAGIFKAIAEEWVVTTSQNSNSVAVTVFYRILAAWNGSDWDDWSGYEPYTARGDHYVVKRDGSVNQGPVEQLSAAMGWNGDLRSIAGPPPTDQVQITVKGEEYNGETRFKVQWVNPGDYTPQARGASNEDVNRLQKQFGSQLRAAASSVRPAGAAPGNGKGASAPARAPAPAPAATTTQEPPDYGDVPPPDDDDLPY